MIYLAGDHHAEPTLAMIRDYLRDHGLEYQEFGYRTGKDPEAGLQDFIPQVAEGVRSDSQNTGILVCGSGSGVEIGANRFTGIRAALCHNPQCAEWARVYDDANILCLASWAIGSLDLCRILDSWYSSEYDGSTRRRKMLQVFDLWH